MSTNNTNDTPSPPSLTTLSPSLLTAFGSLRGGGQRLFKAIYGAVWRHLWPISRLSPMMLCYSIPGVLKSIKEPGLSVYCWFTYSKLYILSTGGKEAVNTLNYSFTGDEGKHIRTLINNKLIVRTSFDPAHPYAVKPSHITKTYISFTPYGVRHYNVVVEQISKAAMLDTMQAINRPKEKGQ